MSATMGTRLYTWWKGELVGTDSFGNKYYREKGDRDSASARRWVIYEGDPEGSKVPPEWHAWLHRTVDAVPSGQRVAIPFEKPHLPNLTGTAAAYHPSGSLVEAGHRPKATGDYEAWRPE